MKTRGTLVFTGGKGKRLGHINIWRTVATTLISLSRQYNYGVVNLDDIALAIEIETLKMVDAGEVEPGTILITREQIARALAAVARASASRANNYIPAGIVKVNSVYYRFEPVKK